MKKSSLLLIILSLSVACTTILPSCNGYQSILKSSDTDYKYMKAKEFYNKGHYYKALAIFEELLTVYKGTETTRELYYLYSNCHYELGNYLIAAYHYKSYHELYPNSKYAEECLYKYAESFEQMSPTSTLDQTYTDKAIEAYQYFINTYPGSEYVALSNISIDQLRRKLEVKAMESAQLYYKTGNYNAAAVAYENILQDYPDIQEGEYIAYRSLQSRIKYAESSIYYKQAERYDEVIESAVTFISKYPASEYASEVVELMNEAHVKVIEAHMEHGQNEKLDKKEEHYKDAIKAYEKHYPKITEEKQQKEANDLLEEAYYMVLKTNFQQAQNSLGKKKENNYQQAVKAYETFTAKYDNSKFAKDAEKMYESSLKQLNKTNDNG